ncbi:MAG: hypothetical protein ACJ8R9_30630 [Steroidobacteraceae bacterium]
MSTDETELASLREISPQASLLQDGGIPSVLLPQTRLVTPSGVQIMDTVLCPKGLSGYVTRLLLERRIPEKGNLNWQQVMLLGRAWHTWSWNQVSPDQSWIRIFAEHARALR